MSRTRGMSIEESFERSLLEFWGVKIIGAAGGSEVQYLRRSEKALRFLFSAAAGPALLMARLLI